MKGRLGDTELGRSTDHRPPTSSHLPALLRWAGPILAGAYGLGQKIHRASTPKRFAPIATVCIGNLTAGGTGKTPAVKYLTRALVERGRKPAILMRGYKAQGSDEAEELKATLDDLKIPILVGADRLKSALLARQQGCDVALLDDGFQHWALARDLDIVLIDATDPFGGGYLLPWGRLREKPEALSRAGVLVITRADALDSAELAELKSRLSAYAPGAVVACACHKPIRLRKVVAEGSDGETGGRGDGEILLSPCLPVLPSPRLEALAGLPIIATCGIGNPSAFRRTLEDAKANIMEFTAYDDHHAYTPDDLRSLESAAARRGASAIVVTSKDAVKLAKLPAAGKTPLWALEVQFEFMAGEPELWQRVEAALKTGDGRNQNK